jgi:putative endonuclease
MTKTRKVLGAWGERLAAAHLTASGMVLLDRNWRTAIGEIDIVARDGDAIVFTEVKTRRGTAFGDGAEAVDGRKSLRLRNLAAQWLAVSGLHAREVRFDVVTVLIQADGPQIRHLRGAIS